MSIHSGISCDLCRKKNFSGRRYKCLICQDFDLCSICYEKKSNLSIERHSIDHPMQLIITANDYEHIYFRNLRTQHSPMSLTCPLCHENGFSLECLIQHVNERHLLLTYSVLCPICFIRQKNLSEHLHQHTKSWKEIQNANTNEKELKTMINSHEQSLLEKLINNSSKKNENQQRNFFLHYLLTDLFNKDIQL
jgi:hypothetical protein